MNLFELVDKWEKKGKDHKVLAEENKDSDILTVMHTAYSLAYLECSHGLRKELDNIETNKLREYEMS